MSETESEYSDAEVDDQSVSTNTNNPVRENMKEDGELSDDDDDDDELYENPPIKIGEEIDNVVDNDSDGSEEYDIEKDYDYDLGPDETYNPMTTELDTSSDEEDSDVLNDDYLKRFDKDVLMNHMDISHPESSTHNYEEVRVLSNVMKDADGNINDTRHQTIPILTKFEKSKILGLRAKQIDEGAMPFVKVMPNIISGYTIANMELIQKKIPFIIKRPLPNGKSEYWKVSDLEVI